MCLALAALFSGWRGEVFLLSAMIHCIGWEGVFLPFGRNVVETLSSLGN